MLDFCTACDNLLTLFLSGGVTGQRCLSCGALHPLPAGVHTMWERLGTGANAEKCKPYVDPAIHGDATIPTTRVFCERCDGDREVKYVRYGSGLSFLYACPNCETFWTRTGRGRSSVLESNLPKRESAVAIANGRGASQTPGLRR